MTLFLGCLLNAVDWLVGTPLRRLVSLAILIVATYAVACLVASRVGLRKEMNSMFLRLWQTIPNDVKRSVGLGVVVAIVWLLCLYLLFGLGHGPRVFALVAVQAVSAGASGALWNLRELIRKDIAARLAKLDKLYKDGLDSEADLQRALEREKALAETLERSTSFELGFDISGLPSLLKDASIHFVSSKKAYDKIGRSKARFVVNQQYTGIDQVHALQRDIFETLINNCGLEEFDPKEKYDAFRRPEEAITNKLIYTFPFLMTQLRLTLWGALQYGTHEQVGLLVQKKNTPLIDKLKSLECDCGTTKWLDEILFEGGNGTLVAPEGYLYNELLALMVRHSDNPAVHKGYIERKRCKSIPADEIEDFFRPNADLGQFEHCSVLVDLADKSSFQKLLLPGDREFILLKLSHGLDVPVGIGFSLPMLPDLLLKTDNILAQLSDCAKKYAQRREFKDGLMEVGIHVDPTLLTFTSR